jgi:predicted amidohydrolase
VGRGLSLALAGVLILSWAGDAGARGIRVAAVQLEVTPALYGSVESFTAAVTGPALRAVQERHPDLIIFPEYTCAFLALSPYSWALKGSTDFADFSRRISQAHPRSGGLTGLLAEQAPRVEETVKAVFSDLARRSGAAIVAGTYFALQPSGRRGVPGELRDRAVVFTADGTLAYTQDKVFLTDFEREVLGISPGKMEEAFPFRVSAGNGSRLDGALAFLTICRDTFFPEWEKGARGADLWIDIKANGVPFTAEEREGFRDAIPARLSGSGVPQGMTVCLEGRILDLFWEGESSLCRLGPGGVETTAVSRSADGADILYGEMTY